MNDNVSREAISKLSKDNSNSFLKSWSQLFGYLETDVTKKCGFAHTHFAFHVPSLGSRSSALYFICEIKDKAFL